MLLAVDPGWNLGWALFDNGTLYSCGLVSPKSDPSEGTFCRAHVVASHVFCCALPPTKTPIDLVIEYPQVYRQGQLKGDPNDLLPLVAIGQAVAQKLAYELDDFTILDRIKAPHPHDWKGSVPKDIMQKRIERALSTAEVQTALAGMPKARTKQHNVWDAIGIGLWALDRLNPKRGET